MDHKLAVRQPSPGRGSWRTRLQQDPQCHGPPDHIGHVNVDLPQAATACAKCTDLFTGGRGSARMPAAVMPRNGKDTGVASPEDASRGRSCYRLGQMPGNGRTRKFSFWITANYSTHEGFL
jgi:hypothetical protein